MKTEKEIKKRIRELKKRMDHSPWSFCSIMNDHIQFQYKALMWVLDKWKE